MSGRYYRRRGYYRNNNRRSYYWRRGSSTRSKSWGNMKAAKQQADQSTFTINIPSTLNASSKKENKVINGINTPVVTGVYALNIYDLMRRSEFYQSYAGMYDEFKIDRIKVKLLPTEFTVSTTNGKYSNVTVYTAWDRTGLSKDQILLEGLTDTDGARTSIGTQLGNNEVFGGIYCIVGDDITTYSSSESRTVNPGTNTSIVRWLNPKTMSEKAQWLSTNLLQKWYENYDEEHGRYYGIPTGKIIIDPNNNKNTIGDSEFEQIGEITGPWEQGNIEAGNGAQNYGAVIIDRLSTANKDNPCFLLENTGFNFKPTLLVGIYPSTDNRSLVKFNVETEVVCTFRGLRKAKVVAA